MILVLILSSNVFAAPRDFQALIETFGRQPMEPTKHYEYSSFFADRHSEMLRQYDGDKLSYKGRAAISNYSTNPERYDLSVASLDEAAELQKAIKAGPTVLRIVRRFGVNDMDEAFRVERSGIIPFKEGDFIASNGAPLELATNPHAVREELTAAIDSSLKDDTVLFRIVEPNAAVPVSAFYDVGKTSKGEILYNYGSTFSVYSKKEVMIRAGDLEGTKYIEVELRPVHYVPEDSNILSPDLRIKYTIPEIKNPNIPQNMRVKTSMFIKYDKPAVGKYKHCECN